jgi:hypothetical protein
MSLQSHAEILDDSKAVEALTTSKFLELSIGVSKLILKSVLVSTGDLSRDVKYTRLGF